ncbi:hypothetical protein TNCV_4971661 [Trichonephila clavipes]|nr:hypothetical protein TNCV_4971661 [Trichonephila clavipes]
MRRDTTSCLRDSIPYYHASLSNRDVTLTVRDEEIAFRQEWKSIPQSLFDNLIVSMLNRSSCAAEQFRSDASLEAVDQRAPNNSKNWQWTTEGDVRVLRSTSAPHGGE